MASPWPRRKTFKLAGSATLTALSIAIDFAMKISGAKDAISLPWRLAFPFLFMLKFDLSGVPIFCAMALFDVPSAAAASAILGFFITMRSGNVLAGAMKGLAEFWTVAGSYVGLVWLKGRRRVLSTSPGLLARAIAMCLICSAFLPLSYLPFLALFNVIQGAITTYLGLAVIEALERRAPHLIPEDAPILPGR